MPASWRSRICSGRYGVTEPTHSPESLNRFGRSAKYLARTFRFPPSDMQDAAQEALIRAWQAPPDKPLAYYEVAMRRRLIDHQRVQRPHGLNPAGSPTAVVGSGGAEQRPLLVVD